MKREFETLAMGMGVGVVLVMGALKACDATPADADRAMRSAVVVTLQHACGPCDHVGECGDYECRPGVDGWQLKAGAR